MKDYQEPIVKIVNFLAEDILTISYEENEGNKDTNQNQNQNPLIGNH